MIKKKLTKKQKKVIKALIKNLGDNKKPESIKKTILKAGYSKNSAHQQTIVLKPIKEKMEPIIKNLLKEREEILREMKAKRGIASYSDLVRGLDITTKNIQLLGGKPTENLKIYRWDNYENEKDNNIQTEILDEKTSRGERKMESNRLS